MIQAYIHLRIKFKNVNSLRFNEAQDVQELRHEIAVWQRAAASLSSYSKDEDLVRETLEKKCGRLTRQLKKKLTTGSVPIESYKATLEELEAKVKTWLTSSCKNFVWWKFHFFPVPDSQQGLVGEVWCYACLCHQLFLLALDARNTKTFLGMDGTFGSNFVANPCR